MDDVGCRAVCARDSGRRMTGTRTRADVDRLLADPSPATRADLAAKVGQEFERGGLTQEERWIAEEIVRVMARDAALRVRQALAEHLKESKSLPSDVARLLASDVEAVAVPVLQYSTALTDEELIMLLKGATCRSGSRATWCSRRASAPPSDWFRRNRPRARLWSWLPISREPGVSLRRSCSARFAWAISPWSRPPSRRSDGFPSTTRG